jgi:hypothetical protein
VEHPLGSMTHGREPPGDPGWIGEHVVRGLFHAEPVDLDRVRPPRIPRRAFGEPQEIRVVDVDGLPEKGNDEHEDQEDCGCQPRTASHRQILPRAARTPLRIIAPRPRDAAPRSSCGR